MKSGSEKWFIVMDLMHVMSSSLLAIEHGRVEMVDLPMGHGDFVDSSVAVYQIVSMYCTEL